ncbi:MAG: hypothetical protein IJ981_03145 [Clostridia bacterium]|nr:hypothetical protein [Clostridia bacterium]
MESIAKLLKEEAKKTVRLPKAKDDRDLDYVPVCVNGYIFQVKRGVEVKVPATVYNILEDSGYLDA